MKFGIRGGHSPYCKGAMGLVDEQVEVRKIANIVREQCEKFGGNTVINCDSNAGNEGAELSEGVSRANSNGVNEYISIHMNAGGGHGSEIWLYDNNDPMSLRQAEQILKNLNKIGFRNRGIKYNKQLYDLYATKMPAMIIEIMFVDSTEDKKIYDNHSYDTIAEAISAGLSERSDWNIEDIPVKVRDKEWKYTKVDRWIDITAKCKMHIDQVCEKQ